MHTRSKASVRRNNNFNVATLIYRPPHLTSVTTANEAFIVHAELSGALALWVEINKFFGTHICGAIKTMQICINNFKGSI